MSAQTLVRVATPCPPWCQEHNNPENISHSAAIPVRGLSVDYVNIDLAQDDYDDPNALVGAGVPTCSIYYHEEMTANEARALARALMDAAEALDGRR